MPNGSEACFESRMSVRLHSILLLLVATDYVQSACWDLKAQCTSKSLEERGVMARIGNAKTVTIPTVPAWGTSVP